MLPVSHSGDPVAYLVVEEVDGCAHVEQVAFPELLLRYGGQPADLVGQCVGGRQVGRQAADDQRMSLDQRMPRP